jgi:hypothetical protein
MKKQILILIILFLNSSFIFSQDIITELNGFKLRQYKEAVKSEYNKPFQVNNFDDGFVAEIFLIKPDSTAYVIFEYPSWNKEIIFSIQIYGAFKEIDPQFKNIKMGISEIELTKIVGKPSNSKEIGEYGKVLEYENTNYSFEINKSGKLASIKIVDNYNEIYPKPNVEKLPSLEKIKSILNSNNSKNISEILSPEIEIYLENETLFFKQSWEKEINSDFSTIFKNISEIIKGINEVNSSDENQYEENMRLVIGENPKHVLKFKTGIRIKEIVMKWENGKYLIWEIKT